MASSPKDRVQQKIDRLRVQAEGYKKKMVAMNHDLILLLGALDEFEEDELKTDTEKK